MDSPALDLGRLSPQRLKHQNHLRVVFNLYRLHGRVTVVPSVDKGYKCRFKKLRYF